MKQEEKAAIARLMTELVKSDTKICASELKLFSDICTEYGINRAVALADAQKITLADAVNVLVNSDDMTDEDLQTLILRLRKLSLADGDCEPSEALLLTAITNSLDRNGDGVIDCSCDVPDNINPFTVFYVENDYDDDLNAEIKAHYREIVNEFNLAGFEFVYIPKRAENFQSTNPKILKEIIEHLAPMMVVNDNKRKEQVYEGICNLDTGNFCRTLLCIKLGLESLYDTEPSFLVKLGDSRVMFKPVHNYYKFMIKGNVLDEVRRFVDDYKKKTKSISIRVAGNGDSCEFFDYIGFNKAIFDLLAFPGKSCESNIFVDVISCNVKFDNIGGVLDVYAYERALYVFLLYANVMGITIRINEQSPDKIKRNNALFGLIYAKMGGESVARERFRLDDKKSSLSRIKKALKQFDLLEKKEDLYYPIEEDGVLAVKVNKDKVYVWDVSLGKKVLMKDCVEWQKLLKQCK